MIRSQQCVLHTVVLNRSVNELVHHKSPLSPLSVVEISLKKSKDEVLHSCVVSVHLFCTPRKMMGTTTLGSYTMLS